MNKDNLLITFILILVSLIWAGSFISVKITVDEISPINLAFIRFLIATPFMFFIILLRKREKTLPKKELPALVVLGLSGVTLIYIFQYIGIEYTTASTASVLINVNVIFIAILSFLFLKEQFSLKKTGGVALSFIGVIIVIFAQMRNEAIAFSDIFLLGCILVLLSAGCWSIYSIVGKRILTKHDPITVTAYAFAIGTVFYLPFISYDIATVIQNISINGWMAILYLAFLSSVFGYICWYYALSKIEASRAAVFLNLIPLFTITMSFFFNEIPTIIFLVGAILIIYGVYLTQKN
jgi:drug/metabolite transporter (DMT)-like permease